MDIQMKQNRRSLREVLSYAIVGATVTGLNFALYYLLSRYTLLHYELANIIAFIIANIYAFFANKLFVFRSPSLAPLTLIPEALGFSAERGLACILDLLFMFVGVSLLSIPDMLVKAGSSATVIILNYIISKYVIFKKKREG